MLQQPFKEVFTFTKRERRGIFILLLIAFILLLYDAFGPIKWKSFSYYSDFQYQVERFTLSQEKVKKEKSYLSHSEPKKKFKPKKRRIEPRPFDPNMMSFKQWLAMGLSEKQARTIEKYKRKGGRFRKPEDLRRIYCISEEEYEALSSYIVINELDEDDEDFISEVKIKLNLNEVNEEEIQQVSGIGPVFAKRIIKYRKMLGGYSSVNQLNEVYGMDTIRFQQVRSFFEVTLDSIHTISLNSASFRQILRHPYISKPTAAAICDYRKLHGSYKSVEELRSKQIVSDSLFQKIYLYFAAE